MLYKSFRNKKLSALGLGTMRLPQTPDGEIDQAHTAKMIDYALSQGINYIDTAWKYHGGTAESVIGDILSAYPRESFYLADKFPGFDLTLFDKMEEIFYNEAARKRRERLDSRNSRQIGITG